MKNTLTKEQVQLVNEICGHDMFLYIFYCSKNDLFKVGVTDNPERRVRQLNNEIGVRGGFIGLYGLEDRDKYDAMMIEKSIHNIFKQGYNLHEKGEWFHLSNIELSIIGYIMENIIQAEPQLCLSGKEFFKGYEIESLHIPSECKFDYDRDVEDACKIHKTQGKECA